MECEEGERQGEGLIMGEVSGSEGWWAISGREINFDVPADNLAIELTRSLQSNLVLTPL